MAEYQVKKLIKAIVSVTVNTNSPVEALEKAEKIFKKGIFIPEVEYIDGTEKIIGYDNLDLWNVDIEE